MNYLPPFYFSPSHPSRWWANLRLGKFQCLKLSFFTQLWASLRQGATVCKCRRAKNIQGENKPVYDKPSNWKHKLFSQKERRQSVCLWTCAQSKFSICTIKICQNHLNNYFTISTQSYKNKLTKTGPFDTCIHNNSYVYVKDLWYGITN